MAHADVQHLTDDMPCSVLIRQRIGLQMSVSADDSRALHICSQTWSRQDSIAIGREGDSFFELEFLPHVCISGIDHAGVPLWHGHDHKIAHCREHERTVHVELGIGGGSKPRRGWR